MEVKLEVGFPRISICPKKTHICRYLFFFLGLKKTPNFNQAETHRNDLL